MSSKKDKSKNLEKYFMSIAMNLAKDRVGLTGLNPSVGCLIVKNNKISSNHHLLKISALAADLP